MNKPLTTEIKKHLMIEHKALYSGHYTLQVLDGETEEIKRTLEFDNLITDMGLDMLGDVPMNNTTGGVPLLNTHVEVGTGSAAPSFSDTGCQTPLALNPSNGSNQETATISHVVGPPSYWKCVKSFQYPVGAAAGNLTEIVVGTMLSTDTHLRAFSRALILDGGGAPTTLTILPSEILRVTYEWRLYYDEGDTAYSFNISGVTYSGTKRRCNVNFNPNMDRAYRANGTASNTPTFVLCGGPIGAITANAPGGAQSGVNAGSGAYVAGTHYLDFTATWSTSVGNGTWGAFTIQGTCCFGTWQYSLSPALVKSDLQQLTITHRFSWGRYTP